MATSFGYVEKGYGQVEPNRLLGISTGDMESQAPAFTTALAATPTAQLEQGQFVCVVYETGTDKKSPMGRVAIPPGAGTDPLYMVYNEVKLYDDRQTAKDYVMLAEDQTDGVCYPRLIKMNHGDVFTTNAIAVADPTTIAAGDNLSVNAQGFLAEAAATHNTTFKVTKVYTLPDGQRAVKVQVIIP